MDGLENSDSPILKLAGFVTYPALFVVSYFLEHLHRGLSSICLLATTTLALVRLWKELKKK